MPATVGNAPFLGHGFLGDGFGWHLICHEKKEVVAVQRTEDRWYLTSEWLNVRCQICLGGSGTTTTWI